MDKYEGFVRREVFSVTSGSILNYFRRDSDFDSYSREAAVDAVLFERGAFDMPRDLPEDGVFNRDDTGEYMSRFRSDSVVPFPYQTTLKGLDWPSSADYKTWTDQGVIRPGFSLQGFLTLVTSKAETIKYIPQNVVRRDLESLHHLDRHVMVTGWFINTRDYVLDDGTSAVVRIDPVHLINFLLLIQNLALHLRVPLGFNVDYARKCALRMWALYGTFLYSDRSFYKVYVETHDDGAFSQLLLTKVVSLDFDLIVLREVKMMCMLGVNALDTAELIHEGGITSRLIRAPTVGPNHIDTDDNIAGVEFSAVNPARNLRKMVVLSMDLEGALSELDASEGQKDYELAKISADHVHTKSIWRRFNDYVVNEVLDPTVGVSIMPESLGSQQTHAKMLELLILGLIPEGRPGMAHFDLCSGEGGFIKVARYLGYVRQFAMDSDNRLDYTLGSLMSTGTVTLTTQNRFKLKGLDYEPSNVVIFKTEQDFQNDAAMFSVDAHSFLSDAMDEIRKHNVALVTGDGFNEVPHNYNYKTIWETQGELFLKQLYLSAQVASIGATVVLKYFHSFPFKIACHVQNVACNFEMISLVKMPSSHPMNYERYLVLKNCRSLISKNVYDYQGSRRLIHMSLFLDLGLKVNRHRLFIRALKGYGAKVSTVKIKDRKIDPPIVDSKRKLNELLKSLDYDLPRYRTKRTGGVDNAPNFKAELRHRLVKVVVGLAGSKKMAENSAANLVYTKIVTASIRPAQYRTFRKLIKNSITIAELNVAMMASTELEVASMVYNCLQTRVIAVDKGIVSPGEKFDLFDALYQPLGDNEEEKLENESVITRINLKDIEHVATQAGTTRANAYAALHSNSGDVVSSVMELTSSMKDTTFPYYGEQGPSMTLL